MRIALFHNENAGDGTPSDEIRTLLERHGHQLVHIAHAGSTVEEMLGPGPDLVVAAGGDGTVAAAARLIARRGVPLAVLPLGTANNIARSLDSDGDVEQIIRGWEHASLRPFDIGIAAGDWGERPFLESVGGGLIPAGIEAAVATPADSDASGTHKPSDGVRLFRDALSRLEPRRWTITVDGSSMTGDFLLVEVLNMPSIGPNLVLSADADPSDGYFSVVLATQEDRQLLLDYLDDQIAGGERALSLTPRFARHVDIQGWREVHVDDELLQAPSSSPISMSVVPAAIEFLTGTRLAP